MHETHDWEAPLITNRWGPNHCAKCGVWRFGYAAGLRCGAVFIETIETKALPDYLHITRELS